MNNKTKRQPCGDIEPCDYNGKPIKCPTDCGRNMTESDWQRTVIDLLQRYKYRRCHFRGGWSKDGKRFNTPIQGDAGLPDIIAARLGRVLFIELKTDTGKLSPDQEEWRHELGMCQGIE